MYSELKIFKELHVLRSNRGTNNLGSGNRAKFGRKALKMLRSAANSEVRLGLTGQLHDK